MNEAGTAPLADDVKRLRPHEVIAAMRVVHGSLEYSTALRLYREALERSRGAAGAAAERVSPEAFAATMAAFSSVPDDVDREP